MFVWVIFLSLAAAVVLVIAMEYSRNKSHKNTVSNLNERISSENVIFDFKGSNGRLVVCENKIFILKNSVPGDYSNNLATNKSIPMSSITSIQVQEVSSIYAGFIQFGVLGERAASKGSLGAYYNENSILLKNSEQVKKAMEIKKYIENCISEQKDVKQNVTQQASAADEILKLKQLLDMGAITQEEFEAKKKQLLDL